MKIEFELRCEDSDESNITTKFCKYIIRKIKIDMYYGVSLGKIQVREQDILDSSWILWRRKPKHINMDKLVNSIINSIVCLERRNKTFIIMINPHRYIPYSRTKLETVARFIDKGNESTPPTMMFSRVLNEYRKNLSKYWDNFISEELNRPRVTELVVIR